MALAMRPPHDDEETIAEWLAALRQEFPILECAQHLLTFINEKVCESLQERDFNKFLLWRSYRGQVENYLYIEHTKGAF